MKFTNTNIDLHFKKKNNTYFNLMNFLFYLFKFIFIFIYLWIYLNGNLLIEL